MRQEHNIYSFLSCHCSHTVASIFKYRRRTKLADLPTPDGVRDKFCWLEMHRFLRSPSLHRCVPRHPAFVVFTWWRIKSSLVGPGRELAVFDGIQIPQNTSSAQQKQKRNMQKTGSRLLLLLLSMGGGGLGSNFAWRGVVSEKRRKSCLQSDECHKFTPSSECSLTCIQTWRRQMEIRFVWLRLWWQIFVFLASVNCEVSRFDVESVHWTQRRTVLSVCNVTDED